MKASLIPIVRALSLSFFVSHTTTASETPEKLAKARWEAGTVTMHVVTFGNTFDHTSEDKTNGEIKNITRRRIFETSYIQTISDFQKNLLVSFTDVVVSEPVIEITGLEASSAQIALAKLTALSIAWRPDYIVSSDGKFIDWHQFEQYEAKVHNRLKSILGASLSEVKKKHNGFMDSLVDKNRLKVNIENDLEMRTDWNEFVLDNTSNVNKAIAPAYSFGESESDMKRPGVQSYHGNSICKWETPTACAVLRFESNKINDYKVQLIVDPGTLSIHAYHTVSTQNIRSEDSNMLVMQNSTLRYSQAINKQ